MRPKLIAVFLIATGSCLSQTTEPVKVRFGNYELIVRLPPGGLYAGEESEIEFHISDITKIDPVLGSTPVIRASLEATISMPAMPGMPKFHEQAHAEGVPGDYGIHPTFAHGGQFHMSIYVTPLAGGSFAGEFPLFVGDAQAGKSRQKLAPAFRMELAAVPKVPKAGEQADLQFTFHARDAAKESLTQFDLAHERLVHLVIVRDDLGTFAHLHPEMRPGGVFHVAYKFPAGGEYHLFADVAPKGAGSQILAAKIKVSGKAGERFILQQTPAMPVADGDLKVTLKSAETFPAMKTVPITFTLKDAASGSAPTGMEPYLGARGHLLMVGQDGVTFVHAHPDETRTPGEVTFLARLPRPGLYRAWAQFQRNGQVRTASFVIKGE